LALKTKYANILGNKKDFSKLLLKLGEVRAKPPAEEGTIR